MSRNCLICNLENPEPAHFWKEHKVRESVYYTTYLPRFDKLTGESMAFKSRDGYLLNDFSTKLNLKQWLKAQTIDGQRKYLKEILVKRKEFKNLTYIPTQVEQRSAENMVGIKYYNTLFNDYYKLCEELGFKSRGFHNITEKTILKRSVNLRGNPILCDSREQSILDFNNKTVEISTLPVGDYTIKNDNHNIFVERKSLNDLISTFGPKNFPRFKRELIRAQALNSYIILLVENNINTALGFDHSTFYNRHTQMTATFLFHQIRTLLQEHSNWQIGFCKSRADMQNTILRIFEMGDFWKKADIQLAIDLGLFKEGI